MERTVVVRGRVVDNRHIELDEPVEEVSGAVEVTLRPAAAPVEEEDEDILDFLARITRGTRSKEEIDRYLHEERESWERPAGWPWDREK